MTEQLTNLFKAIHAVQSEISVVHKDAINPHFRSRYATLGAVLDVVRPVILKHGLIFMQAPGMVINGCIELTTIFVHVESGERVDFKMSLPLAKGDPQGAGSAISYGCRYSLMSFLALSALEDDDAEEASKPSIRPQASSPRAAGDSRGSAPSDAAPAKLSDVDSLRTFEILKAALQKFDTRTKLSEWAKGDVNPTIQSLQRSDYETFRVLFGERLAELPND